MRPDLFSRDVLCHASWETGADLTVGRRIAMIASCVYAADVVAAEQHHEEEVKTHSVPREQDEGGFGMMAPPPVAFDGFLAFGDESGSDRRLDPDTYILAAAVIDPEHIDVVRDMARTLKLPRAKKAHWRNDSAKQHDAVIAIVSQMPIEGVIVVRQGSSDEAQARPRGTPALDP